MTCDESLARGFVKKVPLGSFRRSERHILGPVTVAGGTLKRPFGCHESRRNSRQLSKPRRAGSARRGVFPGCHETHSPIRRTTRQGRSAPRRQCRPPWPTARDPLAGSGYTKRFPAVRAASASQKPSFIKRSSFRCSACKSWVEIHDEKWATLP